MADDAPVGGQGGDAEDPERALAALPPVTSPTRLWRTRGVVIAAMVALGAIIVVNVLVIFASPWWRGAPPAGGRLEARRISKVIEQRVAAMLPPEPVVDAETGSETPSLDGDEDPDSSNPDRSRRSGSVKQAVTGSCSTSVVGGLSREIIRQARCIAPNAFVPVPARPNLVTGPNVFLYMEASARDRLASVLAAHPTRKMKVNSALRTVAQQYLLWRWASTRRCGIQLATPPGESNHETGLALDISDPGTWRPALEANEFQWLGAIDRVHFDYKGARGAPHNVDVQAFQQLWNHAHPDDAIEESGVYNAATQQRLEKSPARGFAVDVRCDAGVPRGGASSPALAR
ncbi:MAG: D-alanyl-D-alanine carboxypeptidase family protein [Polyangiaceae bacterium]